MYGPISFHYTMCEILWLRNVNENQERWVLLTHYSNDFPQHYHFMRWHPRGVPPDRRRRRLAVLLAIHWSLANR